VPAGHAADRVSARDAARARLFPTQLIANTDLSADTRFVNLLYFSDGDSREFETYGYVEDGPLQESRHAGAAARRSFY
jgi:hypothetical protein